MAANGVVPTIFVKFPLTVGGGWNGNWARSGYTGTYKAVAVATEKKEVPAGTFDSMKIELVSQTDRSSAVTKRTYWYAPVVGRVIAMESKTSGGDNAQWVEVLVANHATASN